MAVAVESEAFRRAALRSERQRVGVVLALCAVFAGLSLVNQVLYDVGPRYIWLYLGCWGFLAGYEAMVLWGARRAEVRGTPMAGWAWVGHTIVEGSLPTVALLALSVDNTFLGPWRALYSSPVVAYCLFIVLSTLRLSPGLSLLAGAVSAGGYVVVYIFTLNIAPDHPSRYAMPAQIYFFFPVSLMAVGATAAAVAHQIRRHVVAALAEAETRRRLDRVENEIGVARGIQMGLLPKGPPGVVGYDVAGWSRPADQTGGDYYDWMELPDGNVMFTIADATGHGIGPALLVAACRAYFRALGRHGDPVAQVVREVDELVTGDVPEGKFITAAVAVLDPRGHRVSMYSAGHGPVYWYRAREGKVQGFHADQPPLGLGFGVGDGEGKERVVEMGQGDVLVMVSDGFFECSNASGGMLGTEKLGEAIEGCAGESAEGMVGRMREVVEGFVGGCGQGDDMTVVVVKRRVTSDV